MERAWDRAWSVVRRVGYSRSVGAVYVADRMATAAERRYFDSLVSTESARLDPNVALPVS